TRPLPRRNRLHSGTLGYPLPPTARGGLNPCALVHAVTIAAQGDRTAKETSPPFACPLRASRKLAAISVNPHRAQPPPARMWAKVFSSVHRRAHHPKAGGRAVIR